MRHKKLILSPFQRIKCILSSSEPILSMITKRRKNPFNSSLSGSTRGTAIFQAFCLEIFFWESSQRFLNKFYVNLKVYSSISHSNFFTSVIRCTLFLRALERDLLNIEMPNGLLDCARTSCPKQKSRKLHYL